MRELSIDPDSTVAPFEQVKQFLTAAVESGELTPGTKLPTVRALAADLGVAANTVARSYRELEASGVVETRGRSGTFVAGRGVEQAARAAAVEYAARVRSLGLDDAQAVALVERALR